MRRRLPVADSGGGRVSAYRLHLLDSVPFRKSLALIQEAGCPRKGAVAGVNGVERQVYR